MKKHVKIYREFMGIGEQDKPQEELYFITKKRG